MKPSRVNRILMTADAAGGVWTYALELSRALQRYGVEVHLAVLGPQPGPDQLADARSVYNVTLHQMACKLEWMDDPWEDVAASGQWLQELESVLGPNIIHLNGFTHGALPWNAPVLVVGHSCVLSWHEAVKGIIPWKREFRYYETVLEGLRCASAVTAPGRAMLKTLQRIYGPFKSAAPIYNGCSSTQFRPRVKGRLILTAGRLWDEGKNIKALASIARHLPWPVYAAGPVSLSGAGENGIDGLTLLGMLDRETLAQWMGHASIFALPARYEPFGLGIQEAALAGCALVLGDIPSLRELWDGAALFVPPTDPGALQAALTKLIDNPSLIEIMANKARGRALRRSPEKMGAGYYELYTKLFAETGVLHPPAEVHTL